LSNDVTPKHLEHLIRTAAVVDRDDGIVAGSEAILACLPDLEHGMKS